MYHSKMNAIKSRHEELDRMRELYSKLLDFGDSLAKSNGYPTATGIDAIAIYLANKHHWLPSQVSCLSLDTLNNLLADELAQENGKNR